MNSDKIKLELLAPAKNLEGGIAAIDCGADAVYIGAPKFGARVAAGNSLSGIKELTNYAHKYYSKVYVTINTILYDSELDEVKALINDLYEIGVDAIIFQDMSILKMDLPPIPLYASTQTHNYEVERIQFLDQIGIQRIILARELSLKQIEQINQTTTCELEYFVHGALCVCMSGQCYLSYSQNGRSANRGECSQPCRMKYSLIDSTGKTIVKDRHLLSLKDLNVSAHLNDLINAGVTSFKIEGRLKDISYVKNITAHYNNLLNDITRNNNSLVRASSGFSEISFQPDPQKTFNRGYTEYFIENKKDKKANINSPKSIGEFLGRIQTVKSNKFLLDSKQPIRSGDGICYYNNEHELTGFNVNKYEDGWIFFDRSHQIEPGMEIYRNYDLEFHKALKQPCVRKVNITISLSEIEDQLIFSAEDEDKNIASITMHNSFSPAENKEKSIHTIQKQLSKSGNTIFSVKNVSITLEQVFFIPVSELNNIRRELLEKLSKNREEGYKRIEQNNINQNVDYPSPELDYRANVSNELTGQFYKDHKVNIKEKAFELESGNQDASLMRCKYCIKNELDMCKDNKGFTESFYLLQNKNKYQLEFNCSTCEMYIRKEK